jgi:FkbM family methyltransferase
MRPQFQEWFAAKGDLTHRLNYPLNEDSIVLDLGGYQGDWSQKIWDKFKCHILIFEPIPSLAEDIKQKFSKNKKIKVFNFGLSSETKKLNINFSNDGSSFNTNIGGPTIECEVRSIVEFLKEEKIDKIDLIKINIEGDEFPVLFSLLENDLIGIFDNIQVQFHTFVDNCYQLREEIQKKLEETHHITYNYDFVWENWKKN